MRLLNLLQAIEDDFVLPLLTQTDLKGNFEKLLPNFTQQYISLIENFVQVMSKYPNLEWKVLKLSKEELENPDLTDRAVSILREEETVKGVMKATALAISNLHIDYLPLMPGS